MQMAGPGVFGPPKDRQAAVAVLREAADRVQDVVAAQGELETFRNFQNQLFWREKPVEAQLRRWLQNGGRYLRYPPLLVAALEPDEIPRPLVGVLTEAGF